MTQPYWNGAPGTGNYSRYMPQGYPGRISGFAFSQIYPHINNLFQAETWTITPPASPTAAAQYTVTFGGAVSTTNSAPITISATADADPTALEIGTALYNAFRLSPQLYGAIEPTLNTSSGVITLEVVGFNAQLQISASTGVTVAKTVTGTLGKVIPFGRFVGRKSSYYQDPTDGSSTATLIDDNTSYTILGVTMAAYATERVIPGNTPNAQPIEGYLFGYVMQVCKDTGANKGVWIETVEPDLTFADSLYIATSAGNEGKLTRTATNNVSLAGKASIAAAATATFGGRTIALVSLHL